MHGSRIGGTPPVGVFPPKTLPSTRYFATLEMGLNVAVEVSVFLSIDYSETSPANFVDNALMVHNRENPLIQVVAHRAGLRTTDETFRSEVNGLGLIIEPERPDPEDRSLNLLWNHHKIGGFPFFAQEMRNYQAKRAKFCEVAIFT